MNELQIFSKDRFLDIKVIEESRKNNYMGFFYILEYGENCTKIGSTKNPYRRLNSLLNGAEVYGNVCLGRFALSIEHTNYRENEFKLHRFFSDFRRNSCELFNLSFDRILRALPKDIDYRDESKYFLKQSKQLLEVYKKILIGESNAISMLPDPGDLADLIFENRQIMLDAGDTPEDILRMTKSIFDAWCIPTTSFFGHPAVNG